MKQAFGLVRRPWGVFYLKNKVSGEQISLKTRDRAEAERLMQARNESESQPHFNVALARVYMNGADPKLASRTWQEVMEHIVARKKDETQRRWEVAIKDPNFDFIRHRPVVETRPEHFDKALADGKVSSNVYLRRIHNHALGMPEPFRREGSYDGGEPGSVFYRPQQHDVLIYDTVGGELRIHAGTQGERELYRRNFGLFVFEDENFFPGEGKYTLQPLIADGAAALNCVDVEGIDWVKLKELEFLWLGSGRGNLEREIRKANDLFAAFETRGFKLKEGHDLKRAVFQVKFTDAKRPRSVTIAPTNRAKYERDDDGTFLEAWLKKRGFIMEHNENDGAVANA